MHVTPHTGHILGVAWAPWHVGHTTRGIAPQEVKFTKPITALEELPGDPLPTHTDKVPMQALSLQLECHQPMRGIALVLITLSIYYFPFE